MFKIIILYKLIQNHYISLKILLTATAQNLKNFISIVLNIYK